MGSVDFILSGIQYRFFYRQDLPLCCFHSSGKHTCMHFQYKYTLIPNGINFIGGESSISTAAKNSKAVLLCT